MHYGGSATARPHNGIVPALRNHASSASNSSVTDGGVKGTGPESNTDAEVANPLGHVASASSTARAGLRRKPMFEVPGDPVLDVEMGEMK